MSILSRFTVTPLLYACGALLALSLGLGISLKFEAAKVSVAQATTGTALAKVDTVTTERDAWKTRVDELTAANLAFGNALTGVSNELQVAQGENTRISVAGAHAVAKARADAADADRTLKTFTAKFQAESRKPDCTRALEALATSCPALEDY
jgi:hypothetical protein